MNVSLQRSAQNTGLLADDDVLPQLRAWQLTACARRSSRLSVSKAARRGRPALRWRLPKTAALSAISPAAASKRRWPRKRKDVIASGANRMLRYGKGSPYFDIKLPCGSGLDLYFDQSIGSETIDELLKHRAARRTATLRTSLPTGTSTIESAPARAPVARSGRDGDDFVRVYPPPLRLLLLGTGPSLIAIAALGRAVGLDLTVWSPDEQTRQGLFDIGAMVSGDRSSLDGAIDELDAASATVLVFHDHDAEPEILARILRTQSFYVGVLGNHAVHRQRLAALHAGGFDTTSGARLRAPIGSIAGAKSKATLAVGVLAEMLETAKTLNLAS